MSQHLARGQLLRRQGRLAEAEAFLRQAIAAEPDDAMAHAELADCLSDQEGRRRDALAAIDRALALEPALADLHARRALILSRLDRDREALDSVAQALSLDPDSSFLHAVKAQALAGLQRYAEAEEACRQALALDADDGFAANLLAHMLRVQGKRGESQLAADKLLADDPEDPYAHFNAGWTALQGGDHQKAEGHFREALRLDAAFEPAREGLLESFRARSAFYRVYLRWSFWMQRFSGKAQWGIVIGFLVAYHFGRRLLAAVHPLAALALLVAYLGFVLWVWLAPGIGNFLVLLDRSARLALRPGEAWQGACAGGGFFAGLLVLAASALFHYPPGYVLGGALLLGAVPACLAFANDSPQGRWLFGAIFAYVWLAGLGISAAEALRHPAEAFAPRSLQLIALGVLGLVACTWLGNVPRLRQAKAS